MRLAEKITAAPLTFEQAAVETARDRYLINTLIGRYVVHVFYKNESRLQKRGEKIALTDGERALAQALYARYIGDAKLALLDPERQDVQVTPQYFADVDAARAAAAPYLRQDERRAADDLSTLWRENLRVGMTAADGLRLLNDEALFQRVKNIATSIRFLDTNV